MANYPIQRNSLTLDKSFPSQLFTYTNYIEYFFILAYPNAKISPPKRGDSDFMMRSNKLNSAVDILYDQLRSKIDLNWDRLQVEFKSLDPGGSGHVGKEEFKVG